MKWLKARKSSATEMAERRPPNPTWNPDYMLIRNLLISGSGCPPSQLNNFRVVP